ncbi:hypothetical protein NL676_017739 [Syzygium grande]|nr:hypothetical protein NL676_017739 [Syzygium grande]
MKLEPEKFKSPQGTKISNCRRNLTIEVIEGKDSIFACTSEVALEQHGGSKVKKVALKSNNADLSSSRQRGWVEAREREATMVSKSIR